MEQKFKAYSITNRYGVDDLAPTNPYKGEWRHFDPFYSLTEEEYKSDVKGYEDKINAHNATYINKLQEEGRYKEEYVITFNFMDMPEFDNKPKESPYSNFGILIPNGDNVRSDFKALWTKGIKENGIR